MRAAYVEFQLESATMNTRWFYASRQGTHKYFTREAVGSAITYSETLQRSKDDEWTPIDYGFSCTPASPIAVRTFETVYKAGDDPNAGLLRYGRQELLMPGSRFRFIAWGEIPELWEGQIFLIGKKRAAALITTCIQSDVQPDTTTRADNVMPIQSWPLELAKYETYVPLIITARYAIIQVPLRADCLRLVINNWGVPLLSGD